MNYCERRNYSDEYKSELKENFIKSADAEIAVYDDKEMINIGEHDAVIGWCSPDEVAKVITIVSSATTANEIESKIKALKIV